MTDESESKMVDVKVFATDVEESASRQINELCSQPCFDGCKVRIMPDVHAGAGCVIGFTANLGDKVVPNLVGVDIGCGMLTANVSIPGIIVMSDIDERIRNVVPLGFDVHDRENNDVSQLDLLCFDELRNVDRLNRQLGTLGGGNHFVEIGESGEDVFVVIHSGSRNLGLQVANIYQRKAVEQCADNVPKDLKYLQGELAEMYLHDMRICQEWAKRNRSEMMSAIIRECGFDHIESFSTVHNYIGDDGIIRKGAISARQGERVLIPMNMRDGSIIGVGKGNDDWNNSAPHGAGRVMGRKEAARRLSLSDFERQMEGIWSSCINVDTLDESPMAYKRPESIMGWLGDTVDVKRIVKPIYNLKA